MTWESFFAMSIATLVLVATPGPVVLATIARSVTGGFRASIAFLFGVMAADLFYAGLAMAGLAYVAAQFAPVFLVIKYVGAAYLVYLGIKMIRERISIATQDSDDNATIPAAARKESLAAGWLSGLLVTLGNPKLILFYVSFLPTFVDLHALNLYEAAFASGWIAFLFFSGNLIWALGSARMGKFLKSPRAMRRLNIGAGAVLMGAGAAIAVRS
ncbi:LysE family translocator [Aestuariispira ectoiniformans]|uniref:LysE family translocator n=1 Tax=Aestuariispira ectoiniformans TaxID=2775080 RepID=UPI00223AD8D1|nr:LysE family translocator [Aestuariispira ectoiniformans]